MAVNKKLAKALKEGKKNLKYLGESPKNTLSWNNRVLLFTPSRGLVRTEWMQARYGQIIPTNWSLVEMTQFLSPFVPIEYQLADAQNLFAKAVVEGNYEWVIYIEDDNLIPPDLMVRFNQYMIDGKVPVVSGIYFTKSHPGEPLLYRGAGNGYYKDWKFGDLVWVDGIPFGCRLEHAGLIKAAWKTSPEYRVGDVTTRRVFEQPNRLIFNQEKGGWESESGTTDLAWCKRIMKEKLFTEAGFPEYDEMKYPFLVDTNIFVRHIDQMGRQYPIEVPKEFLP